MDASSRCRCSPPPRAHWAHTQNQDKQWIIGNDGKTIFYGAAFEARNLEEQTGLVAHQVLHIALRHVPRERELSAQVGDVDLELFGTCADAIVNSSLSHLEWLVLPKGSVYLDTLLLRVLGIEETPDSSLHQWDTESLYRAVDDRESRGMQSRRSGSGRSTATGQHSPHITRQSTPSHPACDTDPSDSHPGRNLLTDGPRAEAVRALAATAIRDLVPDADSPEHNAEQAHQWELRLMRAHASDGAQSLLRQLLADTNTSRTPWQHLLRTRMQRSLAQRSELNWSRPTRSWIANRGRTSSGRRMPWQPGFSYARKVPRLCVLVDVSGSVDDSILQRFANEIDRLLRIHRAEVYLIIGDDRVRKQCRLTAGCKPMRNLKFTGGGGTDIIPLLAAASALAPDIGIYLTDLDGPAGEAPAWPVIWVVPRAASARQAPFGQRLVID